MSTPNTLFTVTLTADELAHLAAAYRFMRHESEMPSALAALDAAKPARARATRPREAPAAAEPGRTAAFSPNTGNPKVDEFMRRHHNPKRKLLPLPKAPGLPPLRPMKVSEQDAAERAWKSECDEARDRVASGNPSDAEQHLRNLIATHRNPWRLEATERHEYVERGVGFGHRGETRILTSPRHPGMAIYEIRPADPIEGKTFRVVAGDKRSEKVHYAMRAAEVEADELVALAEAAGSWYCRDAHGRIG